MAPSSSPNLCAITVGSKHFDASKCQPEKLREQLLAAFHMNAAFKQFNQTLHEEALNAVGRFRKQNKSNPSDKAPSVASGTPPHRDLLSSQLSQQSGHPRGGAHRTSGEEGSGHVPHVAAGPGVHHKGGGNRKNSSKRCAKQNSDDSETSHDEDDMDADYADPDLNDGSNEDDSDDNEEDVFEVLHTKNRVQALAEEEGPGQKSKKSKTVKRGKQAPGKENAPPKHTIHLQEPLPKFVEIAKDTPVCNDAERLTEDLTSDLDKARNEAAAKRVRQSTLQCT